MVLDSLTPEIDRLLDDIDGVVVTLNEYVGELLAICAEEAGPEGISKREFSTILSEVISDDGITIDQLWDSAAENMPCGEYGDRIIHEKYL